MKASFRIIAFVLFLLTILTSCGTPSGSIENDGENTTEAIATEEVITEADTGNDVYIEREDKEVKNILMIGNSFCYYYVEELCGIASADGYELTVANLYKSGAKIGEHLTSLKNDKKIAVLFVTNSKERKRIGELTTKQALEYAKKKLDGEWDVISLQNSGAFSLLGDVENPEKNTLPYADTTTYHIGSSTY